jgi:hypothetical protein
MAHTVQRGGDIDAAVSLWLQALEHHIRGDDRTDICETFEAFAEIAALRGDHPVAVQLLAGAAAARRRAGFPVAPTDESALEEVVRDSSAALGAEQFSSEWSTGEVLDIGTLAALTRDTFAT